MSLSLQLQVCTYKPVEEQTFVVLQIVKFNVYFVIVSINLNQVENYIAYTYISYFETVFYIAKLLNLCVLHEYLVFTGMCYNTE